MSSALAKGYITRDAVVNGVRDALNQLHEKGWAHCDVHMDNVFVSTDASHTVFLGDLEYLVRTDGCVIPHNLRLASAAPDSFTPVELDELQFIELTLAVNSFSGAARDYCQQVGFFPRQANCLQPPCSLPRLPVNLRPQAHGIPKATSPKY